MGDRGFGGRAARDRGGRGFGSYRRGESQELTLTALLDALIVGAASESIALDLERTAAALFDLTIVARPLTGVVRSW
ncbi:hypothetical protein CI15_31225 [Paraburkholderia monticola]|uniref:Uncharacterized protein n=1 Tax=Paraburkholderia monticola TaxID=1399968 RepID=A0A149PAL0_9BURK|nr:hypothetical protein CI15_31225 [Paraburkholderia monticola]